LFASHKPDLTRTRIAIYKMLATNPGLDAMNGANG